MDQTQMSFIQSLSCNHRVVTEGNEQSPQLKSQQQQQQQNIQISNLPVSRKDVQDLEVWLNGMMTNLQEQKDIPQQKLLEQFSILYTACMKELVRQVKISCLDQGMLLEKVWIAYTDLMNYSSQLKQQMHSNIEQESLNEVSRIHKAYNQQISILQENERSKIIQIEQLNKEISILNETTNYFKKKLMNADIDAKKHKKETNELKLQLEDSIFKSISFQKQQTQELSRKDSSQKLLNYISIHKIESNKEDNHNNCQNEQENQEIIELSQQQSQIDSIKNGSYPTSIMNSNQFINIKKDDKKNIIKTSVVSHLLKSLIFSYDDGCNGEKDDEDYSALDKYKAQLQSSQQELDDLIEQENNEDKRQKLRQLKRFESQEKGSYFLQEKEVQTGDICLSDCDSINILIKKLTTQGDELSSEQLKMIPEYEESIQLIQKQSIQIDNNNNNGNNGNKLLLQMMKNALMQIYAYVEMSNTLKLISEENIKLKHLNFDLDLINKEYDVTIQDIQIQNQQLATLIEEKEQEIQSLIDELGLYQQQKKQDKRNFKFFFKDLVQNHIVSGIDNQTEQQIQDCKNEEKQNFIQSLRLLEQQYSSKDVISNNHEQQDNTYINDQDNNKNSQLSVGNDDNDNCDSEDDEDESDFGSQNQISQMFIETINKNNNNNNNNHPHSLKQDSMFLSEDISRETQSGKNITEAIQKLMGSQIEAIRRQSIMHQQNLGLGQNMLNSVMKSRNSGYLRKMVLKKNVEQMKQFSDTPSKSLFKINNSNNNNNPKAIVIPKQYIQRRYFSQNQEQSQKIINSIQSQKEKILKPELPQNTVQRFLNRVFLELVKNEFAYKIPLYTHCYDVIFLKHCLKAVAERKFQKLMRSLYCYQNINGRFKTIAKYCGLTDNYDETYYQIYIKSIKYFYNIQIQTICNVQDNSLITYEKVYPFIDDFFKDKLTKQHYQGLISSLKQVQQNPIIINGNKENGIRFEELISLALKFYEKTKDEYKCHVSQIFYACDLDKNDSIEFYEFDLMYRSVECENYDQISVQQHFSQEADMIIPTTGEKALTLSKFVDICIDKNLFSKKKCAEFAEVKNQNDDIKCIQDLLDNWEYRFKVLKYRFLKCNEYKTFIKAIIDSLTLQLKNFDKNNSQILWLSYRLIDQESINILIQHETKSILESLLPIKLQMLQVVSSKFEDVF